MNEWALVRMRQMLQEFINTAFTQHVTWPDAEVFCVNSQTKDFPKTVIVRSMDALYYIACNGCGIITLYVRLKRIFNPFII